MKHSHEIKGEGRRIRFYADGTIKIRLYGTHHAEVESITGRDGHVDAVLEGCDMSRVDRALSDPTTAAQCVAFAKAQLAGLATSEGGAS